MKSKAIGAKAVWLVLAWCACAWAQGGPPPPQSQSPLEEISKQIAALQAHLDLRLDALNAKIDAHDQNLNTRISTLQSNVNSRFGALESLVNSGFLAIQTQISASGNAIKLNARFCVDLKSSVGLGLKAALAGGASWTLGPRGVVALNGEAGLNGALGAGGMVCVDVPVLTVGSNELPAVEDQVEDIADFMASVAVDFPDQMQTVLFDSPSNLAVFIANADFADLLDSDGLVDDLHTILSPGGVSNVESLTSFVNIPFVPSINDEIGDFLNGIGDPCAISSGVLDSLGVSDLSYLCSVPLDIFENVDWLVNHLVTVQSWLSTVYGWVEDIWGWVQDVLDFFGI